MSDKFTPPQPLNTAVLFLVFNRLDTTKQVFDAIKQAKPPRLYIAADGARIDKEGEAEKVTEVRNFIMQNIDWKCNIKTLFRDKNLGCKYAVSGAIDWFFESEEMGIILEDDCLPDQSFFWFCEELLLRYKSDTRISSISGSNPFRYDGIEQSNDSYFFSKYSQIWGWASWRRAWDNYDVEMTVWPKVKRLNGHHVFFESNRETRHFESIFDKCYQGKIDTWDFQWFFTKSLIMSLTIISNRNLVKNIGEGEDATHTSTLPNEISRHPLFEISFPIIHPENIIVDYRRDRYTMKYRFHRNFFTKLAYFSKIKLKKYFKTI